ncbi:MAG: glutaredoxin family protein [Chitinispirillaceae bacterium]|nr:glutaredoxin family protein [Chitinispirillaceae bacterium]
MNGIIKSKEENGVVIKVSIGEISIGNEEIDSIAYADERQKEGISRQWNEDRSTIAKKREKAIASQKTPMKLKRVRIYVTEWCGYCRKLEKLLELNKIDFVACDVEKTESCKTEYAFYGQGYTGVPLSVIGNTVVRGYNPEEIKKALSDPSAWEIDR